MTRRSLISTCLVNGAAAAAITKALRHDLLQFESLALSKLKQDIEAINPLLSIVDSLSSKDKVSLSTNQFEQE